MKRRIILFLCFIISVNFIFARDMLVEIKEALQETGLYVFSKEDAKKGIEQSQGYYCSEESAARFYTKLRKKDYDLPKAALRFQEAEEFIEKVLDMY